MSTIIARGFDLQPLPEHFRSYRGKLWRIVEAQHRISTNRLAARNEDQALLEALVDEVKPPLPAAARHLHYLLATPFRYGHRSASRFRAAGERPGIFYASESVATALAETAYWRLHFYARSPDFVPPAATVEHSAICVEVDAARLLDLTEPPYSDAAERWMHPDDYRACQLFAAGARVIGAQAIRYCSVRDKAHRANVALFDPSAFRNPAPVDIQSWHFRLERGSLTAFRAFPAKERFTFDRADFGF